MMNIKQRIQRRVYVNQGSANAAVKRSQLSAKDKKKLLALVAETYAHPPDRLETSVDVGKVSKSDGELEKELMRISLKCLSTMVRYGLQREEFFDRLKETLMAGVG